MQSEIGTPAASSPSTTLTVPAPISGNKSFDLGGQFVWDATSLSLAQACPRKYQLKMIEGWQPRRKSVHLVFGGHYATALEHYYKHRALGDTLDEALEKIVFEALCNTWERPTCTTCDGGGYVDERLGGEGTSDSMATCPDCHGVGYAEGGAPWDSGDAIKTRETLIRTIIWYVDQFADSAVKVILDSEGKPLVERSFTLNVDDGIVFAGHLDTAVEYASAPYVMDQKTSKSTISAYYFEGYRPDIQMSMYTFAGKAIFHLPVKGVIIDAAQIAVGFSRFERGFTFRTDAELDEWYHDMMILIERIRQMTANNYFPMDRTACGNYGGCEFRTVCSRDPAVRRQFLLADFVQSPTWDPLDRR